VVLTEDACNNFKKLQRATELKKKGAENLTKSEQNQLKDLLADADIKGYLT